METKAKRMITPKAIALTGIVAALYVVITVAFPFSYGPIQLRFSEILMLLAFLDPGYVPGLLLGCAIANFFSPMGLVDVLIGTACSGAALFCIVRTKSLFVATLWPAVFNSLIGIQLYFMLGYPLLFSMFTVALGELAVVTCIGYPVFRKLLQNDILTKYLRMQ